MDIDPALLERGRLALRALEFEEQAARYRAACAALSEAIAQAESGDPQPLRRWLERRGEPSPNDHLADDLSRRERSTLRDDSRTLLRDLGFRPINFERSSFSDERTQTDPWEEMHRGAISRARYWDWEPAESDGLAHRQSPELPLAAEFSSELKTNQREPNEREPCEQSPSVAAPVPWDALSGTHCRESKKRGIGIPGTLISLAVHVVVLLVLSLIVIQVTQPNPQVAIQASESDMDAMFESSMEVASADSSLRAEAEPTSNLAELDVAIPSTSNPTVDAVAPGLAVHALASDVSSSMSKMGAGTQMAAGAEFYGSKAAGNTFVFVVDCSPSMKRDLAFENAKSELVRTLSMMKPTQRYFILFFAKELYPMSFGGSEPERYAVRATPENIEKTLEWLRQVPVQKDGRPPIDALEKAMEMQPDGIFVLFDGDTKVDSWTSTIRNLNRSNDFLSDGGPEVPIHVIHFFRDEFTAAMKTLASENDGTYRFVPRPQKGGAAKQP